MKFNTRSTISVVYHRYILSFRVRPRFPKMRKLVVRTRYHTARSIHPVIIPAEPFCTRSVDGIAITRNLFACSLDDVVVAKEMQARTVNHIGVTGNDATRVPDLVSIAVNFLIISSNIVVVSEDGIPTPGNNPATTVNDFVILADCLHLFFGENE